jgi:hypothetical protein
MKRALLFSLITMLPVAALLASCTDPVLDQQIAAGEPTPDDRGRLGILDHVHQHQLGAWRELVRRPPRRLDRVSGEVHTDDESLEFHPALLIPFVRHRSVQSHPGHHWPHRHLWVA